MAASSRRLILIGAANTLDLTDRWMREFERADCAPQLVQFPAYKPNEVSSVLRKLLAQCNNDILSDRAVEFLARKACSTGMGDMRGVLHTCLAALSTFEQGKHF